MSDQPNMESPQSRLEAMLGDIQDDVSIQEQERQQEQPQEVEEEVVDNTNTEPENEEEFVDDTTDTEDSDPEIEDDGEADSDEEQPVETIKLKVNGEEIEKPIDEVVALAQQGLDYTKKTQEVAEQRKALEALQEQVKAQEAVLQQTNQLSGELMEDVAKITTLDQQLAQYQNVDWAKLSDSDFVEAQKLFFTYNQLQQDRNSLVSQFETKRQQYASNQQQMIAEKVKQGKEILAKEIPNWSPETTQEIVSVGKDYGFTDAELNSIIDPRHVKVLHDAMQWRKLQSKNSVTKKKVASAKPVVRPGSKDQSRVASSNAKKMREQLRKTGSSDLASKLIENMI